MASRRVLIVEDDDDIRSTLADALRAVGADVVVARDGVDALERLRGGPRPAVVLLDLRLPRMDGQEFVDRIRSDPRLEDLPVITMTAGSGRAEGEEIVARLQKPFDLEDLRQIVESLFDAAAA